MATWRAGIDLGFGGWLDLDHGRGAFLYASAVEQIGGSMPVTTRQWVRDYVILLVRLEHGFATNAR
jgi:hypothetical protein